jgi:AcrR family transcriptional regulator
MPPKISTTEAQILDAAFELVRSEGIERLSARAVAQQLGCSTQPIYRAFGSMAGLQDAVFERAVAMALGFLVGEDTEHPFLGMGYGNLRFAQDEPHLHRLITRSDRVVRDLVVGASPPAIVLEQMRGVPELAAMDDAQLRRIHTLLWFFSQGLATVFDAATGDDPMPMAREYLTIAGQAVIAWEQREVTP